MPLEPELFTEHKKVTEIFLSLIFNEPSISDPVYMPEVTSEHDAENLGIAPLVCVWNENRESGTFSVSINKTCVEHLLETFVPKENENFTPIRNEIIAALHSSVPSAISEACGQSGLMPSQLYGT